MFKKRPTTYLSADHPVCAATSCAMAAKGDQNERKKPIHL